MKKQPGTIEQRYVSVVSFLVALPLCAIVWIAMKIVWPILRVCAKLVWKHIRIAMLDAKVIKPPKLTLHTPEVFKGAPNLGPAKHVRF